MTNLSTSALANDKKNGNAHIFLSVGREGTLKSHSYYQWIYLFLLVQACCFYITHLFWKNYENNTIEIFLQNCCLSKTMNSSWSVGSSTSTPSPNSEVSDSSSVARKGESWNEDRFCSDSALHDCQSFHFRKGCIFIEKKLKHFGNRRLFVFRFLLFVNLLNVALMFCLNCRFLGFDAFAFLGSDFIKFCAFDQFSRECSFFRSHTFPFFTKCTFFNFGPSGSIQNHDSLCLLTANGVNFVVFTIFWFWFVFLAVFSVVHKICFDCLYFQHFWFFRFLNLKRKAYLTTSPSLKLFVKSSPVGVCFFLEQVAVNANPILFAEFIDFLVQDCKMNNDSV